MEILLHTSYSVPLESGSNGTCNFEVGFFMGLGVA